jgi:hypothetical protein
LPQIVSFSERWTAALGRKLDVKLRLDLALPPRVSPGAIVLEEAGQGD